MPSIRSRNARADSTDRSPARAAIPVFRRAPLARAIALLAAGGMMAQANAQQAFSPAWFATKGAAQHTAVTTGRLPNGQPALPQYNPGQQQQQARDKLQTSIGNLNLAARAIAAQQAAQAAARAAAIASGSTIPDGLGEGGLKVDTNSLTAGWHNAKNPTQQVADGKTTVTIEQTADKAILNWETFNVGRNTTVKFDQDASWAALNRVNDPNARPSEIQGKIEAPGTVLIVNRNGIVFDGSSQVNARNLAAAAANISDAQFRSQGLYGSDANTASFTGAAGAIEVKQGALLQTHEPQSVTQGGGYVLLLGSEVHNAGEIVTRRGQAALAAGDRFIIRKGVGTEGNTFSTTRGNEVAAQRDAGSAAGAVRNAGLIQAREGDITLAGHAVHQQGVIVATTTVNTRGTVHLLNSRSDAGGTVTLGQGSTTAILLEDDGATTALDGQRDALIKQSGEQDALRLSGNNGAFDNYSKFADRRDQSRVEIVSGGNVHFEGDSLTLATGGQIAVDAVGRGFVAARAALDVAGAVGVQVAMAANSIPVNVQGNELRDSPQNRDSGKLANSNVWVDARDLVYVPAGTGGYEGERWYTADGLLELSGYLGNRGHRIGEWAAQGGTVTLGGNEVITQAGSKVNIAGGTLDVQTGYIHQTWLRSADGQVYALGSGPAGALYDGLYTGYHADHARWGVDKNFHSPLLAPQRRLENGYTVGRDAGALIISAPTAVIEGDIHAQVFNGERQSRARAKGVADGYQLGQHTVARAGTLALGRHGVATGVGLYGVDVKFGDVAGITAGMAQTDALAGERTGTAWFDAAHLNALALGGLNLATRGGIAIDAATTLAEGGEVKLVAPVIDIGADVTARGGAFTATNGFEGGTGQGAAAALLLDGAASITLREGATLDLRGLWVNTLLDGGGGHRFAFIDGGSARLASTQDVTLAAGSRIDVSSGAGLRVDAGSVGGRGGDVALIADLHDPARSGDGLLTLDGKIAAHGVAGGGTLQIESGTAIAIGGELLATRGALAAGEAAPVHLVLTGSYTVRAGEILPAASSYQATLVPAGAVLGSARIVIPAGAPLINAVEWQVPRPVGTYTLGRVQYYPPGSDQLVSTGVYGETSENLPVIPAGSRIVGMELGDPGWIVSPAVFPLGIPTQAHTRTLKAGEAAPSDIALAAGTRIVQGAVLQRDTSVKALAYLDADLFQTGFSRYDLNGRHGVVVAENVRIEAAVPLLRVTGQARTQSSGDAGDALAAWMPPQWREDPARGRLQQRAGASVLLRSTEGAAADPYVDPAIGLVDIRRGAAIQVDAGQSIELLGRDITVQGTLSAPGGRIALDRPDSQINREYGIGQLDPGLFLIGPDAVLDAAARAFTATDAQQRRYGTVMNGGRIEIGGALDWESAGEAAAPDAFVVVAAGARLDASGAQARLDVPGRGGVDVASDGGRIVVKSNTGLYLDGTLRAAAGGADAAGGTLGLALQSPNYSAGQAGGDILRHREFELAQVLGDSGLAGLETAAGIRPQLTVGRARYGVDRIAAGGFDSLSLLAHGPLSFDGDVALDLRQSLRLYAGAYALSDAAAAGSRVALSAPHVLLAGTTRVVRDGHVLPQVSWRDGASQRPAAGSFIVTADLIDLRDRVGFGASGNASSAAGAYAVDRRGFEEVELYSRGDVRLLGGKVGRGLSGSLTTEFSSRSDIVVTAAQLYPATGAQGQIVAGWTPTGFDSASLLTLRRHGDATPSVPYSAFGGITLAAGTVDQGGVVRAPLGSISFGGSGANGAVDWVRLLPGSLTSVSGAGLLMPYGGTVDGREYRHDGEKIVLVGAGGMAGSQVAQGVTMRARHIDSQDGSVLDLAGGGELTGAGFVAGRGGSIDVRHTPLASAGPGYGFSEAGNSVYAIVPASDAAYAPVAPGPGFGDPLLGRRITLAGGVPGLPAGTYTLMPSTYALLPGAFRIEIGAGAQQGLQGVAALGQGSYIAAGTLGIANTSIRDALPHAVILTPAAAVRSHSAYNETGYNAFALADAARLGVPRAMLTTDGKALDLQFVRRLETSDTRAALTVDGDVRLQAEAGSGGYAGMVQARGIGEILAVGQQASEGLTGASVHADALSDIDAPRLVLNATLSVAYGESGRFATVAGTGDLIVRAGATLSAADLIIGSTPVGATNRRIVIEDGATLTTVGRGRGGFDSSDGYVFTGSGFLALSNGWVNLFYSAGPSVRGTVSMDIGACATPACVTGTTLVSEGTFGIVAAGDIALRDNVAYGARNLVLGLSTINLGEAAALERAAADGYLPAGLRMNQAQLAALLAGNTAIGAPSLEALVLNAQQAVNVFGSIELDATGFDRLVFGTPAFYGYGGAGDVAAIRAREFVWAGDGSAAGAAMPARLGDGRLDIQAQVLRFGYAPDTQPDNFAVDDRLVLGFSGVRLSAAERFVAAGNGSLAVHHRQGAFDADSGYAYTGGALELVTPLLTAEAGAQFALRAGDALELRGGDGQRPRAADAGLGAQLTLAGRSVSVDTAVALPSGRLTIDAQDDLLLDSHSIIDLAGRAVELLDVTRHSRGGELALNSRAGDIRMHADAAIDLSARNNRGGALTVTALGEAAGLVDLAGTILGAASGEYDAGGTVVPYDDAEISIRAQRLPDFAALNARLNDGEVFGARRFQLKQGDLVVGDGVRARQVEIVVDGGSLTVDGRIDASGFQAGSIRLAAMNDLTINGSLDAHATGLRRDGYGQVVDASNRATVALATRTGTLTIGPDVLIDLRVGTDAANADGQARGTLDLDAPRLGADDVAVQVRGRPGIHGARSIAVNAMRIYDDAPLAATPDVNGHRPQWVTQAWLDTVVDPHNAAFIDAALGNAALADRLQGLGDYRLRPGVEIVGAVSAENPEGDLTVPGDIDLSGYRYGPQGDRSDPARRGAGEPGVLTLRAAGRLHVHGSITDGFGLPAATPDDGGWVLTEARNDAAAGSGYTPFGGDIVLPRGGIVLEAGTRFPTGARLNYDIEVAGFTLPAGTVLPVDVVLAGSMTLPAGSVLAANVYAADGSLLHAAGTVLGATLTLSADMRVGAGMPLRAATAVAAMTWPKGLTLPAELTMTQATTLAQGALIPAMTYVELPGDAPVDLRPRDGTSQGRNWAVAPMLGENFVSWDLRLVAGADLNSANLRALAVSDADLVLADTHYLSRQTVEPAHWVWGPDPDGKNPAVAVPGNRVTAGGHLVQCRNGRYSCIEKPAQASFELRSPAHSVVRTGTGDLELLAAGDLRVHSLYGVYTAGTATAVDTAFQLPRGTRADGSLLGPQTGDHAAALADYRAWYPDHGGNLHVFAGRDLIGDLQGHSAERAASAVTGNWLWRQGSGSAPLAAPVATSWWINFGAYTAEANTPLLTGFLGFGTLGGGNLSVHAGGDAGTVERRGDGTGIAGRSQGLVLAVGSTGRVTPDGQLLLTGGGDLDLTIGGALNPARDLFASAATAPGLYGSVVNLRGRTRISAASLGSVQQRYKFGATGVSDPFDGRAIDPFASTFARVHGGLTLVPGDSAVYLDTLGDLVLGGSGDPGRVQLFNTTAFGTATGGGESWFSLWTPHTAINLASAGGSLVPVTSSQIVSTSLNARASDQSMADGWFTYPSILRAAALDGSVYYGAATGLTTLVRTGSLVLAPSPRGELEILAAGTLNAGGFGISLSGSGALLPTPFTPAFIGSNGGATISNLSADGIAAVNALFALGPNTAALELPRTAPAAPVRFYARDGDIIGLRTGEILAFAGTETRRTLNTWYNAGGPLWVKAGRDIVNAGTALAADGSWLSGEFPQQTGASLRGNLIVHRDPNDVSLMSAGRDILYASFDVAGPGTLEVSAGRNLVQEDRSRLTSIGPVVAGDTRGGASIALMAGMAHGTDWSALRNRYLDRAWLADPGRPLVEQPGMAVKIYDRELSAWLKARFGFDGEGADALAYFDALAPEQQRIFLRTVYYAELRAGGREYNDADGPRFGSYLRGREMIATLFPDHDGVGNDVERSGDIVMFGGAGVRTLFGGDIEMLAPGGQIVVGVQGEVPPPSAGVMTQGRGDIRLFSEQSLLLGLSRIMTTFGGDIFAWSEQGDINAGRGAKTTVLFTPPRRSYDGVGNVALAPQVPSSGAGIATLDPLPEVPSGDIDLIAPLGTIDAGEAGIRVSGNVNLAALRVVNAENIQVKGEATGLPVVAAVNVAALTNASAAANSAAGAASDMVQRERANARRDLPSIFTVRVLGFGDGDAQRVAPPPSRYDAGSAFQVLGQGRLDPAQRARLTEAEQRRL